MIICRFDFISTYYHDVKIDNEIKEEPLSHVAYRCNYCSMIFYYIDSLNYHIGRVHKDRYCICFWKRCVDVYDFLDQIWNVKSATKYQKARGLIGRMPSATGSRAINAPSARRSFLSLPGWSGMWKGTMKTRFLRRNSLALIVNIRALRIII